MRDWRRECYGERKREKKEERKRETVEDLSGNIEHWNSLNEKKIKTIIGIHYIHHTRVPVKKINLQIILFFISSLSTNCVQVHM